jgi:pyruvate dehydrogenase E1 component alpha subunit
VPDQANEAGLRYMAGAADMGETMVPPEHAGHVALYRQMLSIRLAEQACARLFAEGAIPGFIHLSIGQEAVSVGIMSALTDADTIASTHRGHGHALAKGLSLTGFFHELMGRTAGVCGGRGGSMHVADLSVGMLGANGIVGGGIAIALGSGLAQKLRRNTGVAVAFFGDGAMAEGVLHESLNIASLLSVPVLFACEANGWSEFSPTSAQISFSLEALASAYRIPYRRIDSHDVRTIATDAAAIVADMRARVGPYVIECVTHRVRGHFEGDPQRYRSDQAEYVDPLAFTRAALAGEGVQQALLDRIDQDVAADIDAAIRLATQSRIAEFGAARAGVYAPDIAA